MDSIELLMIENQALKARVAELERMAHTDALTGCLNRHSYERRISELSGAETFVYVDLCRLGLINNTLGHEVADGVLATIGACLRGHFDQVYRTGGDELVIILDCSQDDAKRVMGRVEVALEGYQAGNIPVMLAWGTGTTLKQAEAQMYKHKDECHQVIELALVA